MSIEIKSVAEFYDAAKARWNGHPMYRGERSVEYELRPKYGRHQVKYPKKNTPEAEQTALVEFKRRAVPFLQQVPSSNWDWLALAQHHGLPTRLLDWTRNPLVAAYFATLPPYEFDASIYVIDYYELKHVAEVSDPFKIDEVQIFTPRHASQRFVAQQGVFTCHPIPSEIFTHPKLERWILSDKCLNELSVTLHTFGISCASLFPGLDSICEDITAYYVW